MTTLSQEYFGFDNRLLIGARRMSNGVNIKACGLCNCQDDQLKVCSRCRNAWYCSLEHQRQHWKQHKQVCKSKNGAVHEGSRGGEKKGKLPAKKTNFAFDPTVLEALATGGGAQASMSDETQPFQSTGMGVGGRRGGNGPRARRNSPPVDDYSTPIDLGNPLESSQQHRPKTPPLFHVRECVDSQSLEERGYSQEWFDSVITDMISHLNKYGVCVVDDFLGSERAEQILSEVTTLQSRGMFQAGQVVSRQVQDQARGMIRGDKIAWVTGGEPYCNNIGQLVTVVDSLVAKANKHVEAGKLANYNITWRTRAMVACYPGRDAHYVKHVDNPNGDGRCITAIYYLNRGWSPDDGGVLRIYPEGCSDQVASIEPLFDRMLFFWSDRRNPHEVLPARITRYAITVWYLDQREREEYLAREMHRHHTTSPTHT